VYPGDKLSLGRAPATWHVTGAANAIANLFGVSARDSHGDSHRQLATKIELSVLTKLDEIWAELEREQYPVASFDRHSAVRDWPAPILQLALPMRNLAGADLSLDAAQNPDLLVGIDLSGTSLVRTNLSGMNLDTVRLRDTDLSHANLAATTLRGADLSGAGLRYADLKNADLTGAVLDGVWPTGADFSGARMDSVRFSLAPRFLAGFAEAPLPLCKVTLLSIGTIDDVHRELKRNLVASLADALASAPAVGNARAIAGIIREFMEDRSSVYGGGMAR
jgi:uncharacterized protein YjbI with pentapeptide repeats